MTQAEVPPISTDVDDEAIHGWFSLTYANYLVLPRSVLQSMPGHWQSRFVAMLDELHDLYGGLDWPDYTVNARNSEGRFIKDPIPPYNRGRTYVEPCPWSLRAASDTTESGANDDPSSGALGAPAEPGTFA